MSRLIKPRPWAFNSGLTASEWDWFYDELKVFHPMWEGNGPPRDLSGNENHGVAVGGTSDPAWIGGQTGPALSFDESNDYYTVADGPDISIPILCTYAFYLSVPDNSGTAFQYLLSSGAFTAASTVQFYVEDVGAPGTPGAFYFDFVSDAGSGTRLNGWSNSIAPFSGYKLVVFRKFADDQCNVYVDGVNEHLGYSATNQDSVGVIDSAGYEVGRRADGDPNRFFGGEMSYWAKWDRDIGEDAIRQLARDPFGPFHMFDGFTITTGAVDSIIMRNPALIGGMQNLTGGI